MHSVELLAKDQKKTIVFILSAMRSGSTLLKALLAEAPDVSNLPEVNFRQWAGMSAGDVYSKISQLSSRRIIVLKKPAIIGERDYPLLPTLPPGKVKLIVLIRNASAAVASLQRNSLQRNPHLAQNWNERFKKLNTLILVEDYWCQVYENLLQVNPASLPKMVIKYEDLVEQPLTMTRSLFSLYWFVSKAWRGQLP